MISTQIPEQEKALQQGQAYVARGLDTGTSKRALAKELEAHGWPKHMAAQLVAEVASARRALEGGRNVGAIFDAAEGVAAIGSRDFAIGAAAIAVGGLVTLGTYLTAAPGETFVIWYGMMLYGGFRVVRGVTRVIGR